METTKTTREAQLMIASIMIFAAFWFISAFYLLSSLTSSQEYVYFGDDHVVFFGGDYENRDADVDDENQSLSPLITPEDHRYVAGLTGDNFSSFVVNNRNVMVAFYSPKGQWSRKIIPYYLAAAADLHGETVKFAVVDWATETQLAANFSSVWYLTIYLFAGGNIHDLYNYSSDTNRDDIVSWVKLQIHGRVHSLLNKEEAASIWVDNSTQSIAVLAILDSLEGPDSEEVATASNWRTETMFYKTNQTEVATFFDIDPKIKRPALVILEKEKTRYVKLECPFNRWRISNFVYSYEIPLLTELTEENAKFISESERDQLWVFTVKNDSQALLSSFREAAKSLRMQFTKLTFIYVEMGNNLDATRRFSQGFGIHGNTSTIVAYSPKTRIRKVLEAGFINSGSIKIFAEDFLKTQILQQPKDDLKESFQTSDSL